MIRSVKIHLFVCVFIVSGVTLIFGQNNFSRCCGNPIIRGGEFVTDVSAPCVLSVNHLFHMYYVGRDEFNTQVYHATSEDGLHWEINEQPVLTVGPAGNWDSGHITRCWVIHEQKMFRMWYSATEGEIEENPVYQIGYASSGDGIHWQKYAANPIVKPGAAGSFDAGAVRSPVVLKDNDNTYKMWYEARNGNESTVGFAISEDGITWKKYVSSVFSANDDWEDAGISRPVVIPNSNGYEMWYTGHHRTCSKVGHATSSDGILWKRNNRNPVLEPGTCSWENEQIRLSSVLLTGNIYHFWYSGANHNWQVGYAQDFSAIPHTVSFDCNKYCDFTKTDILPIVAVIGGPVAENVKVDALIKSLDGTVQNILPLQKSDDDRWWAEWLIPYAEKTYEVNIMTTCSALNSEHNSCTFKRTMFTTKGPVLVESSKVIQTSGNQVTYKFSVQSKGRESVIPRVTARISAPECPAIEKISIPVQTFGHLNPEEILAATNNTIITLEDLIADIEGPLFVQVDIMSDGYIFWSQKYDLKKAVTSLNEGQQDNDYPLSYELAQNYPNPFNPETTLEFSIPQAEEVTLTIFNLHGAKVSTLVSEALLPGKYKYTWQAGHLASGVYVARLQAGAFIQSRKLILIK